MELALEVGALTVITDMTGLVIGVMVVQDGWEVKMFKVGEFSR